ncbi:alpha/beta fold hydrolase [Dysosmobacter sp. NSJ-60]|uniref:alpha/beta fold hydrolase n=1 Tax=Pusillibacter faecalis TaxID=2714358 RepID=UPI00164DA568|nr:alpha/beta hydrolase [Pusillibacter faecalis]MBC5748925.1 alpha/beta fold hydrolase [Dysosmobacter hominis]MBS5659125.1 alpha/beta fold hydrolase [Oscillibacter sp.]
MDISLYYEKRGAGEPLVLLHGNGEDGSYFLHQMEAFSREFLVYALDTRGHGRSPRGSAPFTISQFAEDLLAFLDEQGLKRVNLLGFSDGGNIALTFALRHPERVRRLVLNGANLTPRGVKAWVQLPIVLGYQIASRLKSPKARTNAEMLGLMVHEPQIPPSELAGLMMPVLVIAGTRDMIREDHTRLMAREIPGARLALIPGNHFIARRNPAAFNRAVWSFFQETAVSGEETL